MLYTSNYARWGSHPNAITISKKAPDWFVGESLPQLAPTWELIYGYKDGTIPDFLYASEYKRLLNKRKVDPNLLLELSVNDEPVFLLCYESPKDFCHRHILAEWVEDKIGLVIPEWKNEKELQEEKQQKAVATLLDF